MPSTSTHRTDATVMLDARSTHGSTSGIGRYVEQLVQCALAVDPAIRFRLIVHPSDHDAYDHPRIETTGFRPSPNSLVDTLSLRWAVDFSGVDLFHAPANLLPAGGAPVPTLLTVHDIMWLKGPGYWTDIWWREWITGTYYRSVLPRSIESADRIATVSQTIRSEILEAFPCQEGHVDVTPNGVDPFFRPIDDEDAWRALEGIVEPETRFVLTVGRGSPYKNHPGAVDAFLRAYGDDPDVHMVLVRTKVRGREPRLRRLLADSRADGRIHVLHRVDGDELLALYNAAETFLFPSFYEGFGLPIVEAMACETPVVTSSSGAPAEVAGSAALTADPRRPDACARALRRLDRRTGDDDLRKELIEAGRRRAGTYEWTRCARKTLAAYRRIIET
jgi:glycosyltransferase involved in cell wall biosynthesis